MREEENEEKLTGAAKVGGIIWNVVFAMMYPILMVFALLVTGVVKVSSLLSNLIVWTINLFKK